MDRRTFVYGLGAGVLTAPFAAQAQQAGKVYRIAFPLNSDEQRPAVDRFLAQLRQLGYIEGTNLIVESRSAGGQPTRFPEVAAEVVRLKPDVIVVYSTRMALAVKAATTTLPVVGSIADPVGFGLVPSLAQHKGNITGVVADAGPELESKRLQLLKEAAPRISRVAILTNAVTANSLVGGLWRQTAQGLGISVMLTMTEGPYTERAYREVFASLGRNHVDAVLVGDQPEHWAQSPLIAELAAKHRVPAIFPYDTGGLVAGKSLMVYGTDPDVARRRLAEFVHRILQGANPADMPFEQISNYRLIINLKTAKALGLTIPPSLLLRADQVIE